MVPLERLTLLDVNASWDTVLQMVLASPFSRLPVYRQSRAHVVGILRVKDLVDRYAAEGPLPLARLMRPVLVLSSSLSADKALAELKTHRTHAAMLVDDGGAAVGLLTIQDVLSELLALAPAGPDSSRTDAPRGRAR
jgi:magnesium and cobalt transporter